MKRNLLFVVLIIALSCKSQNDGVAKVIDIDTFKTEVIGKDVQLVDVRTLKEYNAGHIDDAINIDISNNATFTKEIQNLDKEKPIYVYCQMGGRSNKASQQLRKMGFKTIFDYSGGYGEWSKQH
ncbi:rhodanese-like domain-containing protein [uncultured Kriegella sp.]|uniref:rhodanese-like domain-containing protein n=1 Tax=uncultured Kriegella sp. TaxID=1798910 RepID=UPI0030D7F000|tara:strand:+ start:30473 stop:30844 length:372 start_codon:yes stop_codon:yes gene_type:complete